LKSLHTFVLAVFVQQFNPAFAIASAILRHTKATDDVIIDKIEKLTFANSNWKNDERNHTHKKFRANKRYFY
jgi:hypothetical protein